MRPFRDLDSSKLRAFYEKVVTNVPAVVALTIIQYAIGDML